MKYIEANGVFLGYPWCADGCWQHIRILLMRGFSSTCGSGSNDRASSTGLTRCISMMRIATVQRSSHSPVAWPFSASSPLTVVLLLLDDLDYVVARNTMSVFYDDASGPWLPPLLNDDLRAGSASRCPWAPANLAHLGAPA